MSSRLRGALLAGAVSGVLLSLMETASILSQPGAPGGSVTDILVMATWLAVPYAVVLALAAAVVSQAVPSEATARAAAAGLVAAVAIAVWIRTLARLGEGSAAYPVLALMLAAVACAGGAAAAIATRRREGASRRAPVAWGALAVLATLVAFSRNTPGPFGRPGPPAAASARIAGAFAVGLAVALAVVLVRRLARYPAAERIARLAGAAGAAAWILYCGSGFATMLDRGPRNSGLPPAGTAEPGRPNIVLISIDTLRADHLSCYGYARNTSPEIDRLASAGVLFSKTASTASFTLPAHASMMTGQFPSSHGATYQNRDPGSFTLRGIGGGSPMLAEILHEHGYDTAGFVSGPLLSHPFGFARGFGVYDDRYDRLQTARERLFARSMTFRALHRLGVFSERDLDAQRTADEMNPLVDDWLASRPDGTKPFFLFVHYWDPHGPYAPPPPLDERPDGTKMRVEYDMDRLLVGDYTLTPRALADLVALYDGEISWVDRHVGALLDGLRAGGLLDEALVILTSDHGESFGEHDHWEHSRVLYEDVLHVPFIMELPGGREAGRVVDDVIAQPTDILPTVLAAAGIETPEEVEGRNLLSLIDREAPGEAPAGSPETHAVKGRGLAFAELDRNVDWPQRWGSRFDRDLVSARTLRYKYVHSSTGEEELYDLEFDPGELKNLAAGDPGATGSMRALVEAWRRSLAAASQGERQEEIDEGLIENLRSLGYVQ